MEGPVLPSRLCPQGFRAPLHCHPPAWPQPALAAGFLALRVRADDTVHIYTAGPNRTCMQRARALFTNMREFNVSYQTDEASRAYPGKVPGRRQGRDRGEAFCRKWPQCKP